MADEADQPTPEVESSPEDDRQSDEQHPDATPTPAGIGREQADDDLPEWVRAKIRKVNSEAKSLRERLKEQEPLVAAAQEAERAKLSELERAQADNESLQQQLAGRDTELLAARYRIPDDYVEFIVGATFDEKEARAAKVAAMVQSTNDSTPGRPPTDRPVESLKPGASPDTPPVEDHSYPAAWGYMPPAE